MFLDVLNNVPLCFINQLLNLKQTTSVSFLGGWVMVGWWADQYLFSFRSCSFMQACNRDLISVKQSNYRKQGSVHQLLFVAPHLLTRGAFCSVQQLGRAPQFPTFVAEVQQEALFHTACVFYGSKALGRRERSCDSLIYACLLFPCLAAAGPACAAVSPRGRQVAP